MSCVLINMAADRDDAIYAELWLVGTRDACGQELPGEKLEEAQVWMRSFGVARRDRSTQKPVKGATC